MASQCHATSAAWDAKLFFISGIFQGDFTETVDVDYDPEVTNYENLLKMFWSNHNSSIKVN